MLKILSSKKTPKPDVATPVSEELSGDVLDKVSGGLSDLTASQSTQLQQLMQQNSPTTTMLSNTITTTSGLSNSLVSNVKI